MEQHFPSIWFATHKKILSLTKPIVFSDRGCLDILPDQIQYQGKKFTISIRKVTAVSLTSQRVPWVAYALMNVAVVAYLEWMSSGKYSIGLMAAVLGAGNVLGLLVGTNTKWVRIDYQDESNQSQMAYFADGSLAGWGGIFGGTTRLFRAIKQHSQTEG